MTPRRVAMLVNNGVRGDSRVQRMARAAAEGGWDVLVVGRSPDSVRHHLDEDGYAVTLVPVPPVLARGSLPARTLPALVPALADRDVRAARRLLAARDRLAGTRPSLLAHGAWRTADPWVQDLELAFAPVVEEFGPHLLHAHDRHTIALAARSAAVLTARGTLVRWVLDAHEYVAATASRGGSGLRARVRRAMVVGQQSEFISGADAVVTVSDELAAMLRADHALATTPLVVLNAPLSRPSRPGDAADRGPSLRALTGVPTGVPLLVYVGGCAPQRGVDTAVEALRDLPTVHLAVVASPDDRGADRALTRAAEVGVSSRVHRVDYVAPDQVTTLLRDADVGLVPLLHRPNHEISLVTKYLEYLHAGLPVVVSDVRAMAAFTREHGVGEVFAAGDAAGLAAAVGTVLADHDRYRSAVTADPAVSATAWHHQAALLLALYDRLVPPGDPQGRAGRADYADGR